MSVRDSYQIRNNQYVGNGNNTRRLLSRSILSISGKGHHTTPLRVIVSEALVPLTSETGKSFVDGWFDAVTCAFTVVLLDSNIHWLPFTLSHAFFRKYGVGHSDPSLWNIMYSPACKCGILTDFDFSAEAWLALEINRTGPIPFMALELLNDGYWEGKITRHYYHELEAFIWMLPLVFLGYNNGKFEPTTPFLKDWMTSDHNTCRRNKYDFVGNELFEARAMVKGGFKDYTALMVNACLMALDLHRGRRKALALVYDALETLTPPALHIKYSAAMWEGLINVLLESGIDTTRLHKDRPVTFEPAQNQDLFKEIKDIHDFARRLRSPHVP